MGNIGNTDNFDNVLLTIAYDGSAYSGWQRQKNGLAVQEVLEGALETLLGEPVALNAAGRTDAGVHALGQKANFRILKLRLPPENLPKAVNTALPPDIAVKRAGLVEDAFNARYHAKRKTYRYQILNAETPNPLLARYSWQVYRPLDAEAMNEAAALIVGKRDFSAFRAVGASSRTTVRTVFSAFVEREGALLSVYVEGDGFLYNMVRIIAGTLVAVGRGKIAPAELTGIIEGRDRTRAGQTAPPNGLTLMEVEY
ncbi:MAG: tRNA pseudouridine(38-40) synthase TruA [Clostridiales bacterium]|jgi:tRNA pseudouridine38-40 synthase|nr:tRNA pseudouridine(38-40) synthase TruA [Clostridiales bacterium]